MSTNWTSRLGRASAALAIAGLGLFAAAASAEARDYRWHQQRHWNNGWHNGHHNWNSRWNNGWNNQWRGGGWNGWQSSNGYGYTWPQRYWAAPGYYNPYNPPAYYPEPVGRGLTFTIPLP